MVIYIQYISPETYFFCCMWARLNHKNHIKVCYLFNWLNILHQWEDHWQGENWISLKSFSTINSTHIVLAWAQPVLYLWKSHAVKYSACTDYSHLTVRRCIECMWGFMLDGLLLMQNIIWFQGSKWNCL